MKKKHQSFEESNGKKFANWLKEKRFYIVLLCCIMAVSATYFVVDSFQKVPAPQKQQGNTVKLPPTPLPDLTKSFPKDDKESTLAPSPSPSTKPVKAGERDNKEVNTAAKPSDSAKAASAGADADYQMRSKAPLSYPVSGEIITPHTEESLVYSKTLGDWRSHDGVDIKATLGSEVLAADDGLIEDIYTDDFMGITIVIDHLNGLKTVYANLSNSSLVQKGQSVKRGNVISAVGDTAIYETAEVGHLHFELYDNDKIVDPVTFFEK